MATAKVPQRRGYHHGNLREALIAAARRLIAERGPAGFTLVEAARLAGVSAAAPYRHFADRDALLAAVAQRGFAEFDRRLNAAWHGAGDVDAAFLRMGEAYLAFAREEPGYYGAMFSAGAPGGRKARRRRPPRPAGQRTTFAALETAIAQVTAGQGKKLDPQLLAYQVWALSHGIATLAAAGLLPAAARLQPAALLRTGVGALIAGGAAGAGRARRKAGGKKPRRGPARRPAAPM